jgi:hypothetical protein
MSLEPAGKNACATISRTCFAASDQTKLFKTASIFAAEALEKTGVHNRFSVVTHNREFFRAVQNFRSEFLHPDQQRLFAAGVFWTD